MLDRVGSLGQAMADLEGQGPQETSSCSKRSTPASLMWNLAGSIFLVFGIVGAVIPLIPTTPFILVAAACYARGSPRMYRWMTTNRYFGKYLKDYREGRGVPLKVKVVSVAFLWAVIGISAAVVTDDIIVRVVLVTVAVLVSVHVLSIRSRSEPS